MPAGMTLDFSLVNDPALRAVGEKIAAGTRLDAADGLTLFQSPDINGLGSLADQVNRAKHGTRVTFASNQHINPTNVCYLRTSCVFCSFARLPKEEGAYRYTLEQALEESDSTGGMTREFHIVGGLDMKTGLKYYADMFRALKARHPNVHIKALTAVEIAHIARIDKMSVEDVLIALREAGLDTLPGGGAEVFGRGVRATIADKKLAAEDWIEVHRTAHRLGIRSNCTMLYGHVETLEDRIEHLSMLRELQDETGGFLAYIPLAYHPDNNELGAELGRTGTSTTGFDDLRNLAVGRLFLDNFDHVKSHWIMVTQGLSQIALSFGVNDLEGTVVKERIYHEAGAHTAQGMSLDEILRLIRGAGRVPDRARLVLQRDSHLRRRAARAAGGVAVRVGRIAYVNCYPVYGAIDRGIVPLDAELVSGVPSALNRAIRASELDISVVSAVEYANDAEKYLLLPDLAISCDGPVRSVMLFSHEPAPSLHGKKVLVSRSSMTSVALLELLFEHVWETEPTFVPGDAEVSDIARMTEDHTARLVIGDAALVLANDGRYPYVYDLGEVWREWTELPFVFAVWVARRGVDVRAALNVHAALIESRDWGVTHRAVLAEQAAAATGVPFATCDEYLSGLDYGLSYPHLAGLTEFFRRLVAHGRVPNGTLSFLTAA